MNNDEPKQSRPFWKLHWLTIVVIIILSGDIIYSQIYGCRYLFKLNYFVSYIGWPNIYCEVTNLDTSDFNIIHLMMYKGSNITNLIIDILVSLTVILSTAIVIQSLVRNRFHVSLRQIFLIPFVVVLFFILRYSTYGYISSPWWEDWYIEIPIGIGVCCTYYIVSYFVLAKILLGADLDFRGHNT
jgi:hypothetical protein